MKPAEERNFVPIVGIARVPSCAYPAIRADLSDLSAALGRLAAWMHWSDGKSPFGAIIPRGARVVIKPNLVKHRNEGPGGLEPLVTHPSLIRTVAEAALQSEAGEVLVGDAPLQGCDLPVLLQDTGLQTWAQELMSADARFKGVRDFRRTIGVGVHGVRIASENLQPLDRFVLFDLGRESLLEAITDGQRFRVTCYDPRLMAKTHGHGVHQYLIAKEVLEADVVINLPKLKTHKKAGLTCALKNLIGINGNKEYLPHHRFGGSHRGGDCYPGDSVLKRALEYFADRENLTSSYTAGMFWHLLSKPVGRTLRWKGDRVGTDGSWSGNDTIWRTCLDLNRILLYGKPDGTMSHKPLRRVIHVVDGIVAGQGNGPLAPDPLPLGMMLAGENAAAVDWIAAQLLSYKPSEIPLLKHAFDDFRWPLTSFASADVSSKGDLGESPGGTIVTTFQIPVEHPFGWRTAAARSPGATS